MEIAAHNSIRFESNIECKGMYLKWGKISAGSVKYQGTFSICLKLGRLLRFRGYYSAVRGRVYASTSFHRDWERSWYYGISRWICCISWQVFAWLSNRCPICCLTSPCTSAGELSLVFTALRHSTLRGTEWPFTVIDSDLNETKQNEAKKQTTSHHMSRNIQSETKQSNTTNQTNKWDHRPWL